MNIATQFEALKTKVKIEDALRTANKSTAIGEFIHQHLKDNNVDACVKFIQDQIADGHTAMLLRTISVEAYNLIAY